MNPFQKASRSQVFLKLAITGPTGSGKTFSALRLALGLLDGTGKKIAFIDTENKSASLYAPPEGDEPNYKTTFPFDSMELEPPFEHSKFIEGIKAAVAADYGVIIIDSSSHFWEGILEYKSKLDSKPGSNSYTNWNEAGKKFQGILDALLQSKIHIICCMRSKMDYILEDNGKGKQVPRKVGMAPIMRDGISYEFTTVFDVMLNHECEANKDRSQLFTDKIFQITEDTGRQISAWLQTATPKPEPTPALVVTDGPPKADAILKLRMLFASQCGEYTPEDFERAFCTYVASKLPDKKERKTADDFSAKQIVWMIATFARTSSEMLALAAEENAASAKS